MFNREWYRHNFDVVRNNRFRTLDELFVFLDWVESKQPNTKLWSENQYKDLKWQGKIYKCLLRAFYHGHSLITMLDHPEDSIWRPNLIGYEIVNGIPKRYRAECLRENGLAV